MGFFHLQRDNIIRTSIYIGLFWAWGISVSNRIIQPQVRRYLIAISVLIGFWIAVRGIKYSLNTCAWLMRYFWCLYYLPMFSIPLLALFVAAALESCIQSGLIQANTGYEELFMAGRLGAQITDKENRVCIVSSNALELSEEQRKDA